jgi:hypothetical protein
VAELVLLALAAAALAAAPVSILFILAASSSRAVRRAAVTRRDLSLGAPAPALFPFPFVPRTPTLVWNKDRWLGVFAFVDPIGRRFHAAALHVLVDAWFPALAVEDASVPLLSTRVLTIGMLGSNVQSGDAAFDGRYVVESAHAAFARAMLDGGGRALVDRLREATGRVAFCVSGRTLTVILRSAPSASQVSATFSAVEALLEHLHRVGPSPVPASLCHRCGTGIVGEPTRCDRCGAGHHGHCLRVGGCAACGVGRTADSVLAFATTGAGWDGAAATRAPRPEDYR